MNTNVTITAKGQMTVPKALRDQLKMKPGDKCYAWVRNGELIIIPRNKPLEEIVGLMGRPPVAVALEEAYDDAVADAVVSRFLKAQNTAEGQ